MIISRYTRSLLVSLVRRAPQQQQQQQQFINTFKSGYRVDFTRVMSSAPRPVSSTAEPPKAAEGLEPVTAGASSTPAAAAAAAAPAAKQGQPKEAKEGKPKKDKGGGGSSGPLELTPPPAYFEERIKIFDEYKAKYDAEVAGESLCHISCLSAALRS